MKIFLPCAIIWFHACMILYLCFVFSFVWIPKVVGLAVTRRLGGMCPFSGCYGDCRVAVLQDRAWQICTTGWPWVSTTVIGCLGERGKECFWESLGVKFHIMLTYWRWGKWCFVGSLGFHFLFPQLFSEMYLYFLLAIC